MLKVSEKGDDQIEGNTSKNLRRTVTITGDTRTLWNLSTVERAENRGVKEFPSIHE